jgi:Leucine-rich repeat (LRR) protein
MELKMDNIYLLKNIICKGNMSMSEEEDAIIILTNKRYSSLDVLYHYSEDKRESTTALHLGHNLFNSMVEFRTLGFSNLRQLYMNDNFIREIEGLEGTPLLTILNLSNNSIHAIHGLNHLAHLVDLNLSNNVISHIQNIPPSVVILDLSGNGMIRSMRGIENLVNLEDLNLNENQITEISGLENLVYLQTLNILYNPIESYQRVYFPPGVVVNAPGLRYIGEIRGDFEDDADFSDEDEYDDAEIALARRHEDERERQIARQMEIEARRGLGQSIDGDDDESDYEPPPVYSLEEPYPPPSFNTLYPPPGYWEAVSRYEGDVRTVYADDDDNEESSDSEDELDWFEWLDAQKLQEQMVYALKNLNTARQNLLDLEEHDQYDVGLWRIARERARENYDDALEEVDRLRAWRAFGRGE